MPDKRSAFGRALGLFDWEQSSNTAPSAAFGSLALSPSRTSLTVSPKASSNTLASTRSLASVTSAASATSAASTATAATAATLPSALLSHAPRSPRSPRSATFPPPTAPRNNPIQSIYHPPTSSNSASGHLQPQHGRHATQPYALSTPNSSQVTPPATSHTSLTPSGALSPIPVTPHPTFTIPQSHPFTSSPTSLPNVPSPPSLSPQSYPSSLSIPPKSPNDSRFPAVPTPPSMSPRSYPSSMSSEAPPLTPPDRQVTFAAPNRPASFKSTTSSGKKASIGRVNNLFSNNARNRAPIPVQAIARPAPPLPSYESIQVIAHRPEDIAAVRSSLAQLNLTWSLYRELGRPSNLADALERQLATVVASVDRLADLPPFTITVPTQRRD